MTAIATNAFVEKIVGYGCENLVIEKGYEHQFSISPPILEITGKTQDFVIEMTKRSAPQKIGFAIVDIVETADSHNSNKNPIQL